MKNYSRRPSNKSRDGSGRSQNRSSNSPSNRGSNSKGSNNSQNNNNTRGSNNPRGRSNSAKDSHARAMEQWMSPTSQTLTSHIPIINKRKPDRFGKKTGGRNENNSGMGKNGGRNRNAGDRSQRNASNPYPQAKNRFPSKEGRGTGGTGQRGAPRPSASASQNKGNPPGKLFAGLDPFELFCAYHLGIGPAKKYKPANINEVANRFQKDSGTIKQALQEYGMDSGSLLDREFDMALAQLDIQVAPEGVDRIELAKSIYQDYLDSPYVKRDWKKIIEEDRKENRKIFGG